uniref:Uncharacterized protein n=1 Tax=Anopheles atroparvus TaxID=41427 RepID=A0A182JCX4_ANOAO
MGSSRSLSLYLKPTSIFEWASVTGLKCHQCGWDSCGTNEELVECTLERVNQVHGHLQRLVNLPQHQEMPSHAEFVCFELQLTNSHGNRSGTVKSCTLQSAKMCDLNDWQTVKTSWRKGTGEFEGQLEK